MIVADPGGKRTSTWRTHRMCLESLTDETHLLCLQDDSWPCDRFTGAAHAAIAERPDSILCLFVPGFGNVTRPIHQAKKAGQRWLMWRQRAFVPLVAVVYPADVARAIPAFADSKKMHVGRADDSIIGAYARATRTPVWATIPSLVQHRDELPSVMRMPNGKGAPHRLAASFDVTGGSWVGETVEAV